MLMRTVLPKLCDYPVRSIEKLRYADTDRNGHISNAVFAVCCQNARMELLCDPNRVPIPPDTQFAIAKLVLEFRAQMHWAGIVEIVTRVRASDDARPRSRRLCSWTSAASPPPSPSWRRWKMTTCRSALLPEETAMALSTIARPDCGRVSTAATSLGV
jgi:acyl-CoA thioester hydrolase